MTLVLVIDDNAGVRDALHLLLQDDGYTVVEDSDGATLLDYLRATLYGLVVLFDYRIPYLDTEAFLRQVVSEHDLAARHAFICLTAIPHELLPPICLALLARLDAPLLMRPFDIDDLLAAIKQAEQRLQQQALKRGER